MNIITIKDLCFQYEAAAQEDALRNVNLQIHQGECLVLTGESGCGKTTLIRCLNGLIPGFYEGKVTGEIFLRDTSFETLEQHEISSRISTVFQDPRSQFFAVNSTDEVAFGCENLSFSTERINENVEKAFSHLNIGKLKDRSIFQLSSGEKQRLAVASVYAMSTDVILLDEPTANLDEDAIQDIRKMLSALKAEGKTLIISEHRLSWLAGIADRYVYMEQGEIRQIWSAADVKHLSADALIQCGLRSFRQIPMPPRRDPSGNGEKELSCEDLTVSYGRQVILRDLTLRLTWGAQRKIVGVIGENGAGKTTLAKALCGLLVLKGGSIGQAVMTSSIPFVLPVGVAILSRGAVTLNEVILCLLLSMGLAGSLQAMIEFWQDISAIYEIQPRIQSLLDAEELPVPTEPRHPNGAEIVLRDIHFSYGDAEVIHGASFTAKEGTVTALVGPSGSGKSTLAKLIARFWDVNAGAIQIGGVDVRHISLSELYDQISYVSQDNFLFNMSLRDNIRIGKPDASDEEVEQAAEQAGCGDFIKQLSQGYDTNAGDAGSRLSGGERQRLAIARAILKDAPIVILDEATAFTDPENEDKIQMSIDRLTKGKTLIVIAHRLSTIMYADQIVVLEGGEISATGTHEQLLSSSQTYLDMWRAHISAMDWSISQEVAQV